MGARRTFFASRAIVRARRGSTRAPLVVAPPFLRSRGRARMSVSPARGASPPPDRTVEDVQAEDAAFRRRAAEAPAPVPAAEGEALRALVRDASVCDRCVRVAGRERWTACETARARVEALSDEALGAAVATVVDHLDAAHLRPTGIRSRLEEGVDAACHSLVTLLSNVK